MPIFLSILVCDLSQFFLPQPSILSFINYPILINFGLYLLHKKHQPSWENFALILLIRLGFSQGDNILIDQTAVMQHIHTLFKSHVGWEYLRAWQILWNFIWIQDFVFRGLGFMATWVLIGIISVALSEIQELFFSWKSSFLPHRTVLFTNLVSRRRFAILASSMM